MTSAGTGKRRGFGRKFTVGAAPCPAHRRLRPLPFVDSVATSVLPAGSGGQEQHLPRPGPGLPDGHPAQGHAPAVASHLGGILEQRVDGRDLRGDLVGRDVQLFGQEGHVARRYALPHLDLVDLENDRPVGTNLQPRVRVEACRTGNQRCRIAITTPPAEHEARHQRMPAVPAIS